MRPLDRMASRRSLWSLLGQQVPSTAIPGPVGLFKISFKNGQRGTPPFEEGARLSEDIYILVQGLLPSRGFLSSVSLSPCLTCSPARIVATGGLLRFQVVASIAPLTIEGHL